MKNALLLLCLCVLSAACATSGDIAAQQRSLNVQEQRLASLEETRNTLANHGAEIDLLRSKVAALEGKIEDMQRKLSVPTAPPAGIPPEDGGVPGVRINPYGEKKEGAAAPGSADDELRGQSQAGEAGDPAKDLYDRALAEFNRSNYQGAQSLWLEFSDKYKKHQLAPNALFWRGECFYQMRDYPNAILAYQEVIGKYPKSAKYPAALLKQGISFVIIGKKEAGRLVLTDVIKKYPNTPEAKRADEFLRSAR